MQKARYWLEAVRKYDGVFRIKGLVLLGIKRRNESVVSAEMLIC